MKLTEEHYKWIGESTRREGTSSAEKAHWILGAEEAIEKFGGIQWNKYPETKPNHTNPVLVLGRVDMKEGWYKAKLVGKTFWLADRDDLFDGYEVYEVTHWAEINLPNQ